MTNVESAPSPFARWFAAIICLFYGFAKVNGSQFTVLDSELARPMGEVSGFWLTWYYFSYSTTYGFILAAIQIVGAVLLVIPRTALLGALLLLPVVTNIVLIDIFYGVDLGATITAVILLCCVLAIVLPALPRLRAVVVPASLAARPSRVGAVALPVLMAAAFAFTSWVANSNNRSPTPLDGVWTVRQQTPAVTTPWETVFFEYNRAYWVVFRGRGRSDAWHHFELDSAGTIRIWERWMAKGNLVMTGRRLASGEIRLVSTDSAARDTLWLQQRMHRTGVRTTTP